MKRIYSLLLLILLLLTSSCNTKKITGLDLTAAGYSEEFTYVLSVTGTQAMLRKPWNTGLHSLKINGRLFDWPEPINGEPYSYWLYEDIFGQFTAMEDTVNYELVCGTDNISGTIIQPHVPILTFPAFDESRDYRFTWTSEISPRYYVITVMALDDRPDLVVQIPGNRRSFTIDRDFWEGDEDVFLRVKVTPVNYSTHGNEMLAISIFNISSWVYPPECEGISYLSSQVGDLMPESAKDK